MKGKSSSYLTKLESVCKTGLQRLASNKANYARSGGGVNCTSTSTSVIEGRTFIIAYEGRY
jgi:hypothetical protein